MSEIETTPETSYTPPKKETPAQKVERIKRERPSWDIYDDFKKYARDGFASIPEEDLTVRFRAWGLYTQGDGRGTRGEEMPFFMMRLRSPNGVMTSEMVRTVANVSDKYARSSIDITNRQNFQLHWLRIEDIPTLWDELAAVGWTSQGSCGDNTRTVTGCPIAGVDHEELIDASGIATEIDRFLNGNAEFGNLPRKYKMSISGCRHWCTYPEINDIGATAVRRDDGVVGFHIRVGGGLSTRPHLALRLPAFIRVEQLRDVIIAITAIFRDSDELRVNRAKARLKFLFVNHGWTVEKMLAEVERRIGYTLDADVPDAPPEGSYRDHVGVHPQKNAGFSYAGFSIVSGRVTPESLRQVAALAERYGDGTLRTTAMQNLLVLNIPDARLADFRRDAAATGLVLEGSVFQRGTLSCTGSEYCKLALTETKHLSIHLARELEERLPDFDQDIKLHLAGCPNSCGQHWIADLGLQGVLLNRGGEQVEGFDMFVGGGLGRDATLARRLGYRAAAEELPDAFERLLTTFRATRESGERFRRWVTRVGDAKVREALAGGSAGVVS